MADGSVKIDTRMDTRAVQRGVKDIRKSLISLEGLIAKVFSVAALIRFGKKATELASDIQEVQNVVDTAFGDMSYKMEEFAKTSIENFGMSKLSAKQMGSTFMAMARGMGQALDVASDMSVEMTGRMGDIASFYNKSLQEVETIGRAVYSGETEPLKQIGVIMTEAQLQTYALAKGYKKLYKDMSASEKLLIRQKYFLEQTSLAEGDFVKTQDSWANQTKILSERWKEFLSIVGSGLITVLTPVVKVLNQMVASMINLSNTINVMLSSVFGKSNKQLSINGDATKKAAQGYDQMAEAAEESADAQETAGKKMKKLLSTLDELNIAQEDNAESSADMGVSNTIQESVESAEEAPDWINNLIDKLHELADLFKTGFMDGLGKTFQDRIDDINNSIKKIKDSLLSIFTDRAVISSAEHYLDSLVYNLGRVAGSLASIGTTIAQNVLGGLSKYLEDNQDRITGFLTGMFDIKSEILDKIGSLSQSIATIFEAFGDENGKSLTANLIGIWADAFMGVTLLATKFMNDMLGILVTPIVDNTEGLKTALDGILGVLAQIAETVKNAVDKTMDAINDVYDGHIKPFIDSIASGLSELLADFLEFWSTYMQPALSDMATKLDEIISQHVQPMIDKAIELVGSIFDALKAFWEGVLKPLVEWIINNILPVLVPVIKSLWKTVMNVIGGIADMIGDLLQVIKGIIDFITGVFTGDWEKAWQGVSDIVTGIMKFIGDFINTIWGAIGDSITSILHGISAVFSTVLKAIGDLVKNIFSGIAKAISVSMETTKNGITTVLNAIKTTWINIWKNISDTTTRIFGSMWSGIKSVINSILGGIEYMCNGVINGINAMVEALNNLQIDIPDWVPAVGGNSIGFNIPTLNTISLPRLASGAVIPPNHEFMAILGDQKQGTNIEAPLDTIERAVENVIGKNKQSGTVTRVIGQINRRVLFDEMIEEGRQRFYANGNNQFINLGEV